MSNIAFIGLGNMGGGMAANLVKSGHKVFAYDLAKAAIDRATQNGCVPAPSILEAIDNADIVISMLPAGRHVREIYCGESGIIENAKPNSVFIDCSTIDIETAREIGGIAKSKGHRMLDAPVSGGVIAANSANLTFMVGGNLDDFEIIKPILEAMGKRIFHAGKLGNGQAAKLCNNMLLGITMIGTSEAFLLAQKLGLDNQVFFDISSVSSGQNWSMTSYCPVAGPVPNSPANNNYQAGFSASMMLKDLKLAIDAADSEGFKANLGTLARDIYIDFENKNQGNIDFSGIIKLLNNEI